MYISKKNSYYIILEQCIFGWTKMNILNNYRTNNYIIKEQRSIEYNNIRRGYYKDFKLNHAGIFKELPDDVLVLEDYADQIVLRSMNIHEDIILHSIYIKYPELFEY